MASAEEMDVLLVAYADGELDQSDVAEIEAYIAANPAAQRMLSVYRETAALLRSAFPAEAQADFKAIEALANPPGRHALLPRYVWAVAATLVAGMFGYTAGAIWPDLIRSERDRMLSEVAKYHSVYSRETVHLVEVPATQSEHLKAWLGKRVNGTLIIPDFKGAGLTFAGGRLVVLDGEPVAELMYTRDNGLPIALYILAHAGKPGAVTVEQRGDINLATWDDGSHSYIVVGEAASNLIRELATLARTQL
jgi:anti-sigma factor RsiW